MRQVGGGEINGVVSLADVEGPAVNSDRLDDGRDEEVGIGVPVTVSVRRKVVGIKEAADLEVLRDGLTVISGYAGREILRRLDSARGGFDRQSGNGDRSTRSSGIGVQNLIMNDNGLRGIGRLQRRNGSNDRHLLLQGYDLLELQGDLGRLAGGDADIGKHLCE